MAPLYKINIVLDDLKCKSLITFYFKTILYDRFSISCFIFDNKFTLKIYQMCYFWHFSILVFSYEGNIPSHTCSTSPLKESFIVQLITGDLKI